MRSCPSRLIHYRWWKEENIKKIGLDFFRFDWICFRDNSEWFVVSIPLCQFVFSTIQLSTHLSSVICLLIYSFIHESFHPSTISSVHIDKWLILSWTHPSICKSICTSNHDHLYIHQSYCPSSHYSIHLSIHRSIRVFIIVTIPHSFCPTQEKISVSWMFFVRISFCPLSSLIVRIIGIHSFIYV